MEEWRTIEDKFNPKGVYQVSNLGRVRSLDQVIVYKNANGVEVSYKKKGRVLKCSRQRLGYEIVSLGLGSGRKRRVHRLVAKAFIPNPKNLPEVNHIDCDPSNNHAENLEWVTHEENMAYCYKLGRGFAKVRKPVVGRNLKTGEQEVFESARVGAEKTGCSWKHISSCCHGKRRSTGGWTWRFVKN